jgi:hypothetical protein
MTVDPAVSACRHVLEQAGRDAFTPGRWRNREVANFGRVAGGDEYDEADGPVVTYGQMQVGSVVAER